MIKNVTFQKEILLCDDNYCLAENIGDADCSEEAGDIVSTYIGMKALWVTNMLPKKEDSRLIFIYIPEYNYGTYMLKEFILED
jgi:hypothetical protein